MRVINFIGRLGAGNTNFLRIDHNDVIAGVYVGSQWHEYTARFHAPGQLTDLRIDPGQGAGLFEIDWIRLVRQRRHPLEIEAVEVEADRDDLEQVELSFALPLSVEPLRVSTSLEKRCDGDPAAITEAVAELVDVDDYGTLEKIPGGFAFP